MPDSDRVSIDNLTLAPDLSSNDVAPVVHTVNGVKSTYKATMTLLGTFLNKILQYSADLTTTDKTIIGAINEINAGGGGGGAVILYGTTAPASSLGSDGNLYVKYTAGTGGASDVVDALYVKLDGEWCEISTKQVQSDWSQADNTKVDYIKNKPTIPTDAEQLPITSGSATNTKNYIDTEKVANTASYLYTPTVTEPILTNGSNYNHRTFYYKHGTRVFVYIGVSGLQTSSSYQSLFSLPTGYKPRVDTVVKMSGYSFANTTTVRIMTTGEVRAENTQDEGAFGLIEYDAYI